jgi:hypothetical protein
MIADRVQPVRSLSLRMAGLISTKLCAQPGAPRDILGYHFFRLFYRELGSF